MNSKIYNFKNFCESSYFSLYDEKPEIKRKKKKKSIKKVNKEFTDELANAEEYMEDPSYNALYSSVYDL